MTVSLIESSSKEEWGGGKQSLGAYAGGEGFHNLREIAQEGFWSGLGPNFHFAWYCKI